MKKNYKMFAAAIAVAAVMAAAQEGAGYVPFKVNVAATVTASRGGTVVSENVAADEEKTITIPLGGVAVSYTGGRRGQNAPTVTASRGKITLNLPAQSYKSAEIAMYSVNGRRIMNGRAAPDAAANISRRNVAAGVYMLSVKGVSGNTFTTRLTHGGGNMNINAAFGAQNASSPERRLGKSAAEEGWHITVSAPNYKDSSYALNVNSGTNPLQNITLTALDNVVAVTFSGTGATVAPANFEGVTITGGHVVLDIPQSPTEYNVTVSGTTANGSLKIYNRFNLALHLNGVNITNPKGPAVNIQNPGTSTARPVTVNITGTNVLADGAVYDTPQGTEQAKGTLFSERRTTFTGGGALEVSSKGHHAMVVDNDVFFNNANIKITEANDGIHANDSIVINGGAFDIKSKGEAIQNERPNKAIVISDARIKAATTDSKSHGISCDDGEIVISGNTDIEISVTGNGSKGLRSRGNMKISGGDIYVTASGDKDIDNTVTPRDTSTAAGIKVEGDLEITGGKLELAAIHSGGNGKGINVNGNLKISGGEIRANADGDGIKVDGNLTITGGTTRARSTNKQDVDVGGTASVSSPSMLDGTIRQGGN